MRALLLEIRACPAERVVAIICAAAFSDIIRVLNQSSWRLPRRRGGKFTRPGGLNSSLTGTQIMGPYFDLRWKPATEKNYLARNAHLDGTPATQRSQSDRETNQFSGYADSAEEGV